MRLVEGSIPTLEKFSNLQIVVPSLYLLFARGFLLVEMCDIDIWPSTGAF